MAEIVLDKVTKRFPDGALAVHEVDLDIADGEFFILVGPSGCGKSTTLNMIAGLEDITDGELRIDGKRVNDMAPKDRDIAMVFQCYALYPHMSVRENMAFPLRLAKVDEATVEQKVEEAARDPRPRPQHLDRKPANLSGGQRQRVAMGRAIVRNPKAFLMDEPLSNLDAKLRGQMRTSVSKLQKQLGTTTIYVTHDQTEAMTLGDRVVVLRGGVVQQVGTPQCLYDNPANLFVAGFIGSPAMNFVPATLENGTLNSVLGAVELPDRLRRLAEQANAPREVIMGVRPEHFEDVVAARGGTSRRWYHVHRHDRRPRVDGFGEVRATSPWRPEPATTAEPRFRARPPTGRCRRAGAAELRRSWPGLVRGLEARGDADRRSGSTWTRCSCSTRLRGNLTYEE